MIPDKTNTQPEAERRDFEAWYKTTGFTEWVMERCWDTWQARGALLATQLKTLEDAINPPPPWREDSTHVPSPQVTAPVDAYSDCAGDGCESCGKTGRNYAPALPLTDTPVEDGATHADADALIRIMIALMVAERAEGDIPPTKRAWFDKAYTYSNARGDKSFRQPTPLTDTAPGPGDAE